MKEFFVVKEKNSASVYAANLHLLGTPITVVIDDFLPLAKNSVRDTIFASVGKDGALWGLVFEKVFAKYFGNYEMIDAGHSAIGIEVAIGSPFSTVSHEDINSTESETLWKRLLSKSEGAEMVTTGSLTGTGNDQD